MRNPLHTASGIYLKGDTEGAILDITVSGGSQEGGVGGWPYKNQIQIMGNFLSVESGSKEFSKLILTNNQPLTDNYSSVSSGGYVNLTLEENAKFYALLYGGRNDLSAGDNDSRHEYIGDSCGNTLDITLKKGSKLTGTLFFGGRSGQAEGIGIDAGQNPNNVNLYKGYKTDNNKILINGAETIADDEINLNFPAGGIFGAEGWQTNNNYVSLDYAHISAENIDSRKLGIVGGRGLYNFRTYNGQESAISNNNIVVINNSKIATYGHGYGMSVFGGYSYGQAMNNIVAMENTAIDGNVYGGMELLGMTRVQNDPVTGFPMRRELHSNVVSLHNVELVGNSSIYGTATADSQTFAESGNAKPEYIVSNSAIDERTLKAVNRRRGIVYIGGAVKAASAYARYMHFGQYVDTDSLEAHRTYSVVNSYYPSERNKANITPIMPTVFTERDEAITLNQLVAGSFIENTKGFFSYLSKQDANQSASTNGDHNFWVATYANLQSHVNGDGTNLNTGIPGKHLFDTTGKIVKHSYDGGDLSLLAMDDGMILSNHDSGQSIMHDFRKYYQGRVLYLGAHNGKDVTETKDINSVIIAFDKIDEFRKENNQNVNAYGNTQVGLFIDGKGSGGEYNQDPYVKYPVSQGYEQEWDDMVISVPNFEITQHGRTVADATFGFYKYLHFDGSLVDSIDVPYLDEAGNSQTEHIEGGDIKVSKLGEHAGVGLKYWLKSLAVRDGETLVLYGKTDDSTFSDGIEKRDTYTLSAYLTGRGNVLIPENNTVVIGDSRVPYLAMNIDNLSGNTGIPQVKIGENQYTGSTTVLAGANLVQGTEGALGSELYYTSFLNLAGDNAVYNLQGHTQIIGGLNVGENTVVDLSTEVVSGTGAAAGLLTVQGYSCVKGQIAGDGSSILAVNTNVADIYSANEDMFGTFSLSSSTGNLHNQNAFTNALVSVDNNSALCFLSRNGTAAVGGLYNAGDGYLSDGTFKDDVRSLNDIHIKSAYYGVTGSVLHYRGLVQGPNNSAVDIVHADTAAGNSTVVFGDAYYNTRGIFSGARGEKTVKNQGIPVFVIADRGSADNALQLQMTPFSLVDKDREAYEWEYSLGYNDIGETGRDWVLYNSDNGVDSYHLRPESGAYVAAAMSWAKMHMRLHDRFGQAYERDPFDADHKPASAWVRQEGTHTHFKMNKGEAKTQSLTSITQLGEDIIRKEINNVWKYNLGAFIGNLDNHSKVRSWNKAESSSDGYAFGVYGTLYTGNSPDDGFYIDAWAMYNHFDNKIRDNNRPSFKYASHGWVYSLESGLTLPLGETGIKEEDTWIWTLQPEVQVIWDGVKAADAYDHVGTRYGQLGFDNVVLRAGARLHANNMNRTLTYLEANWIHNTHDYGVIMGDTPVYMDGGRDLGEVRMGYEGHLSTNTLGWLTLSTQHGGSGFHNETIMLGLRYMF